MMRYAFFECRNKVDNACAQFILGSSDFFIQSRGKITI